MSFSRTFAGLFLVAALAACGAPSAPNAAKAEAPAYAYDPLIEARSGKVQCYTPDHERKKCYAISAFAFGKDGSIQNSVEILVSAKPVVVMAAQGAVHVQDRAVCGVLTKADLDSARLTAPASKLSARAEADIRARLYQLFAKFLDQEGCTTFEMVGNHYESKSTLGANPLRGPRDFIVWVDPKTYTVGL